MQFGWIPTEVNPADHPSSRFAIDSTLGCPGEGPRARVERRTKTWKNVDFVSARFMLERAVAPATAKRYKACVRLFVE